MRLSALKHGQRARIISIEGSDALSLRLMDLGLLPPTQIRMVFCAPVGDPLVVSVRGYTLSLRREEAARIFVSVEEQP